jgi:hypothetical protein
MDIEENMKQWVGIELSSGQERKCVMGEKKFKRREEIEGFLVFISFVRLNFASGDPSNVLSFNCIASSFFALRSSRLVSTREYRVRLKQLDWKVDPDYCVSRGI